jgi:hypothetical protein
LERTCVARRSPLELAGREGRVLLLEASGSRGRGRAARAPRPTISRDALRDDRLLGCPAAARVVAARPRPRAEQLARREREARHSAMSAREGHADSRPQPLAAAQRALVLTSTRGTASYRRALRGGEACSTCRRALVKVPM